MAMSKRERETREKLRRTHGEIGTFHVEIQVEVVDGKTRKKSVAWQLYREAQSEKGAATYKEMAEDDGHVARVVKVSDEY